MGEQADEHQKFIGQSIRLETDFSDAFNDVLQLSQKLTLNSDKSFSLFLFPTFTLAYFFRNSQNPVQQIRLRS